MESYYWAYSTDRISVKYSLWNLIMNAISPTFPFGIIVLRWIGPNSNALLSTETLPSAFFWRQIFIHSTWPVCLCTRGIGNFGSSLLPQDSLRVVHTANNAKSQMEEEKELEEGGGETWNGYRPTSNFEKLLNGAERPPLTYLEVELPLLEAPRTLNSFSFFPFCHKKRQGGLGAVKTSYGGLMCPQCFTLLTRKADRQRKMETLYIIFVLYNNTRTKFLPKMLELLFEF